MKKKFISVLLVVAMLATLVACGATNTGDETTETNTTVTETDSEAIGETTDTAVPESNTIVSGEDGEAIDEVVHEHEYTKTVTAEATCTENGAVSYVCECGDTYDEEVEAKGHNFGEYVADGNASYTADGTKTAKCANCDETDTVADEGSKLSYTYTDGEAVKYAQQTVNLRSGPSTDFDKVGSLSTNDEVKVTGTCKETGWYRIAYGDGVAYVSNKYLGDAKVEISANSGNSGNSGTGGGNSLANHFGVTLPFTATVVCPFDAWWTNVWNSPTSFNTDTNYVGSVNEGTQVTITDLYGSKNDCMAYITAPDGTSGWVQFSYSGTNRFTW